MRSCLFSLFFCAVVVSGFADAVSLTVPMYDPEDQQHSNQDSDSMILSFGGVNMGEISVDGLPQFLYFKGLNGFVVRLDKSGSTYSPAWTANFGIGMGFGSLYSGTIFSSGNNLFYNNSQCTDVNTNVQFTVSNVGAWIREDLSWPLNQHAWQYWTGKQTKQNIPNYVLTFVGQAPPYGCYFSAEGVAFFDGQINKYFNLKCSLPYELDEWEFTIYNSGAFHVQTPYYNLLTAGGDPVTVYYAWQVEAPGMSNNYLGIWRTDLSKPDGYDYTIQVDYTLLNTNPPPVPPIPDPTNQPPPPPDPTNQPPVTNWPSPPSPPVPPVPPNPPNPDPTNNPPVPDPPAPDTNNPPMPDPLPGDTNALNYDILYSALRHALRDEGQAYDGASPGDYDIDTSSSNMIMQVFGYGSNIMRSAVTYGSNTDLIYGRGAGVLLNAGPVLQAVMPVSIGRVDHFVLPWFDQPEGIYISLQPYANIIRLWREFCLWFLWLGTYFCIFQILYRTFGRVG